MAEKTSTQRGSSRGENNRGSSSGKSDRSYGSYSYNESAVHKPVPGKGGKNK